MTIQNHDLFVQTLVAGGQNFYSESVICPQEKKWKKLKKPLLLKVCVWNREIEPLCLFLFTNPFFAVLRVSCPMCLLKGINEYTPKVWEGSSVGESETEVAMVSL